MQVEMADSRRPSSKPRDRVPQGHWFPLTCFLPALPGIAQLFYNSFARL
jgi:hypothetical protein